MHIAGLQNKRIIQHKNVSLCKILHEYISGDRGQASKVISKSLNNSIEVFTFSVDMIGKEVTFLFFSHNFKNFFEFLIESDHFLKILEWMNQKF